MSLGMATVAGTVMILFAALLGDVLDGVVGHIVGASMINAIGAFISRACLSQKRRPSKLARQTFP